MVSTFLRAHHFAFFIKILKSYAIILPFISLIKLGKMFCKSLLINLIGLI